MNNKLLQKLNAEIAKRFYYIEYPNGVTQDFWKDGNGKCTEMIHMKFEHLARSIQLVQRDKDAFLKCYRNDMNGPALTKALIPLVNAKLKELKRSFKSLSNISLKAERHIGSRRKQPWQRT